VYVYCAYDALLYALLSKRSVNLLAQPPRGTPFAVSLSPDDPEGPRLWHSFITSDVSLPGMPGVPSSRCPYLHLFERREDAEAWRTSLSLELAEAITIVPLPEAWMQARKQVADLGHDVRPGCCER
jgi:hypothetical protein